MLARPPPPPPSPSSSSGQHRRPTTPTSSLSSLDHIQQLLFDAGIVIQELSYEIQQQIPTWDHVQAMLGSVPIFYGLNTCDTFQHNGQDRSEHYIGVAGTFNTGTNLLSELLIANCRNPARQEKYGTDSRGVRWQGTGCVCLWY
jgi:hypothetical protein